MLAYSVQQVVTTLQQQVLAESRLTKLGQQPSHTLYCDTTLPQENSVPCSELRGCAWCPQGLPTHSARYWSPYVRQDYWVVSFNNHLALYPVAVKAGLLSSTAHLELRKGPLSAAQLGHQMGPLTANAIRPTTEGSVAGALEHQRGRLHPCLALVAAMQRHCRGVCTSVQTGEANA